MLEDNNSCIPPTLDGWVYIEPIHGPLDGPLYTWAQYTPTVLKLDFEKAYDKVCWDFLFKGLEIKGFSETWCGWIREVVSGGTVSIRVNDQTGPYFVSHKGVC